MSETCPPAMKMNQDEIAASADALAASMGVESCKTDSSISQGAGQVSALFSSVSIAASTSKTTTIGCEELIVMAEKNDQFRNDIVCILKKSQARNKVNVSVGNKINIIAGKDVTTSCAELNFKQSIAVDIVVLADLSEDEKTDIANVTKNAVSSMTDTLQKSKNGLGATPQGAKMIQDLSSRIQAQDYKKQVDESIKEISIDMSQSNEINIVVGGSINLRGKQCVMDQSIVLNLVSTLILDSVISKNFSSLGEQISESVTEVEQESEAKGAEELKGLPKVPTNITAIIVIIAVCLCLAGVAYMFISGGGLEIAGNVASQAIAKA